MSLQSHRKAGPTTQSPSSSTSTASSSGRSGRLSSPGAARSGADPNNFNDRNGNPTTHSPIEAGDALNPDQSQPDVGTDELEVRLIHDTANPLEISGCPAEGELFERRDPTGVSQDPAWQFVDHQVGTVQAPSRVLQPVEDALYLGGAPQVDDIHQGGLADCYFLASVTSIVAQDPGQIQGMITLSGGQASVRFHRYDTSTNTWVPCTVSVSDDLARHTDGAGGLEGLVASGYRIGHESQHSSWSASVSGTTLWTNEDAYVEVAAWAPILEKA